MMALTLEDRFALLAGRVSYRQLCAGEPAWLTPALVGTEAAREKLTAWTARTPRPWTSAAAEQVLTQIQFHGDGLLLHVVARLLAELPLPVCDYARRRVTWIGVGMGLLGSCGPPIAFDDRPFLILLSADGRTREAIDRAKRVVSHEIAHAWLNDEPRAGSVAISAFELDELQLVSPANRAFVQAQRAAAARDERLANILTDAWGFRRAAETERT